MATFPNTPTTIPPTNLLLPRGVILNGNLNEIFPIDHADPEQIQEFVHALLV